MSAHASDAYVEVAPALPRKNLYRAAFPACEMRGDFGTETPPKLTGHFAVFNSPTEINSLREGNFMETIAPGAFAKSFRDEHRGQIKALFQHGRDPQIGDKPIGPITELREDEQGAYYEVDMLDTSYNRDLLPGLRAGLYGASFRFQVMREAPIKRSPDPSAANPRGIPERTILEAQVMEMGPVTFPAYKDATAGVRSITDTIHDVDALAYAGAVVFDEERMKQCQVFISRGIAPDDDAEPTLDQFAPVDVPDEPAVVAEDDRQERLEQLLSEVAELRATIEYETTPIDAVRDETLISPEQDAPPDSAEPSLAHPIRGRSDKSKSYLRKEKPKWQL